MDLHSGINLSEGKLGKEVATFPLILPGSLLEISAVQLPLPSTHAAQPGEAAATGFTPHF